MSTVTGAAAAATLGISMNELFVLVGNPYFPNELSNDGSGNLTFNSSDITTFATTMASVKTNGWNPLPKNWGWFNWTYAAANMAGYYLRPSDVETFEASFD